MDAAGSGEPDDCLGSGVQYGQEQLVVRVLGAAAELQDASLAAIPGPSADPALDVSAGVPGCASLADAEKAVSNGEFRVRLEHRLTMAEFETSTGWACG